MKHIRYILTLVLFFQYTCLSGYNIRQISNNDGLSNSAVLSIFQDSQGLMWFGTVDGLNLFNGSNVFLYKPIKNNNLSGNLIEDIVETENKILWIQTNYGINRIDTKSKDVNYYSYFIGKTFLREIGNNILIILKDDNVLYYYHPIRNEILKTDILNFKFSDLSTCLVNGNMLTLLMFDGTIKNFEIIINENSFLSLHEKLSTKLPHTVLCGFYEENAFYYISTNYNLYEFTPHSFKNTYITNLKKELSQKGDVSSIIKYKNDFFISFKTNGIIRLKYIPEIGERYKIEEIPINAGVFKIYKDKSQDIVWIGTDGQGVFLLYDSPYTVNTYTLNNIFYKSDKPVRALLVDKENTLWIGTKGDGILKIHDFDYTTISNKRIEQINTDNSVLSNNSVYAFCNSLKNIIWIGHEEGLQYYSFKEKQIKKLHLKLDGKSLKHIHSICELNDSTIWLASVGMGIIGATVVGSDNIEIKNVKQIYLEDGKENYNHFFTNKIVDNETILYGNRSHGLCLFNPSTLELSSILFGNEASNQLLNDVFTVYKDGDNNIWCGTSYGLVKYTPKKEIIVFNEKNGFPNNTIHGILADSDNYLWLSTNNGIIRFDTHKEMIQVYNMQSGLKVSEFSDGAYYKDPKTGNLLFGGISGFVSISETNYRSPVFLPEIKFNNLSIFGLEYNLHDFTKTRKGQTMLDLKHNQNFFTISFSANDYIDGNNYDYLYQLEGQNEWINNENSKSISFINITPQRYTLSVKYINKVTGYESPIYQLFINIRPPWYLSIVAYVIYLVLFLATIVLIIQHFIRKNRKKRLAALEKMRQRHQEEVHESKLRFFTNIAHEFCTPLTLIYGPCNRILSHTTSDRFVRENAQVIQRNTERLNGLIQELIEFRRIETGNRKPRIEAVSITQLFYDIIKSFSEAIKMRGFYFEHEIEPELLWNTDRDFLYTVITNLLSNALKYTNFSGTIKMCAGQENDLLVITISNTGKGIKKEDYDRIFDRYSILDNFENKEDNSISRNGLGLAISYNLIKLLNGEIDIKSELNRETSFIIKLPLNKLSTQTENTSVLPNVTISQEPVKTIFELPHYSIDRKKQTIFIIDDDIEILWLICEIFKNDFNVVPFESINSIEELLEDIYPDIVISDIMMPGLDGISIVKEIKSSKVTNHIPLILISAKHDIEEQIKGLDAGAEMYITVDFLKVSVNRLIARKESLKDYYASSISTFDLIGGKKMHKEDKRFLEKILEIINENLLEKQLSAKFIADKMNISTRQLYRKVNELGETSLADMIKDCKLHMAKNLLLNTKMTIDEVAYNSGFSNRATFYNVFSSRFSCTPKDYRDKIGIDN